MKNADIQKEINYFNWDQRNPIDFNCTNEINRKFFLLWESRAFELGFWFCVQVYIKGSLQNKMINHTTINAPTFHPAWIWSKAKKLVRLLSTLSLFLMMHFTNWSISNINIQEAHLVYKKHKCITVAFACCLPTLTHTTLYADRIQDNNLYSKFSLV